MLYLMGGMTENLQRSKSSNIRASNVWVDIQQVFYRMEEFMPEALTQKPLKAIERIVLASSCEGDVVMDNFCHSGTTLIACEKNNRICYTNDIDPKYCEMTIERLLNYRKTGKLGMRSK
jgi:site-specific DNA-methyltransferase (adenine-specific)